MSKKSLLAIMWTLCVVMCITLIAALGFFVFTNFMHGELGAGLALTSYIVSVSAPVFGIFTMLAFILYRKAREAEKLGSHKS